MQNSMSNFSGLAMSRMEMKKVKGGVVICSFSTYNGSSWSGKCASNNVNTCFGYAQTQAAAFNKAASYPGISYSCY
jgi:hypothetical protein